MVGVVRGSNWLLGELEACCVKVRFEKRKTPDQPRLQHAGARTFLNEARDGLDLLIQHATCRELLPALLLSRVLVLTWLTAISDVTSDNGM